MRKFKVGMLVVAAIFMATTVIYAGSGSKKKKKGASTLAMLPDTSGAAVWASISNTSRYQDWKLFPGKGKFYEGTEPHGMLLTTYVNDQAFGALKSTVRPLPNGSFLVKENYKPDKTLAAITVMFKKRGYNPDAGDWFWAKYGPDGTIMKEGKVAGCIGCHTAGKVNDYVMTK